MEKQAGFFFPLYVPRGKKMYTMEKGSTEKTCIPNIDNLHKQKHPEEKYFLKPRIC